MKSLTLAIVTVSFVASFLPQSGEGKLVKRVESLSNWSQHRLLVTKEVNSGRHREIVRAYSTLYSQKRSGNYLAGLSRAYRRWFYLHKVGIESEPPPSQVGSRIREGLELPASKSTPATLVEAYLFELLELPPPVEGDPSKTVNAIGADGQTIKIPVYDGSAALKRQKAKLSNFARLAAKLSSGDPELQYIVALEMPIGVSRAERIGNLVHKYPDVFGYPGIYTAWVAAKEVKSPSAPEWQSEVLSALAALPEGTTKLLMKRLYPIPGVKGE